VLVFLLPVTKKGQQIIISETGFFMAKENLKAKISWHSEIRKISDLKLAAYNPRRMTDKQETDLTNSLNQFSLADPVIINKNNNVIGGHQRIKILKKQGVKEIDVRVPDRLLVQEEEKELNLRLNKNIAEWDEILLTEFSLDVLKNVGFTNLELGISDVEFSPPPESVMKNLEDLKAIRKKGNEKVQEKTDTEKYLVIVFKSRAEKEKVLKKFNLALDERYIPAECVFLEITKKFSVSQKAAPINKAGSQG